MFVGFYSLVGGPRSDWFHRFPFAGTDDTQSDRQFARVEGSKSRDRGCLELKRRRGPLRHNGGNSAVSATFAWVYLLRGRPGDESRKNMSRHSTNRSVRWFQR